MKLNGYELFCRMSSQLVTGELWAYLKQGSLHQLCSSDECEADNEKMMSRKVGE